MKMVQNILVIGWTTILMTVVTDGDTFSKKLDQLNPTCVYTQIVKEILLTIKFHKQFID